MREGYRRPPSPGNPYFPWQLADLSRRSDEALVGEGGSFLDVPGTGKIRNPVLDTARTYEITESDGKGRYAGTPVVHTFAASPSTTADTFEDDATGRMGPLCEVNPLSFPLIEVTLNTAVPIGAHVLAWPSPASDAMLFSISSAIVPVKALEDGTSISAQPQGRSGDVWADSSNSPIDVEVLDIGRNEPFVQGFRYWAVLVGSEWFSDTGEKTMCFNLLDNDCNPVWVRALARAGCVGAAEFLLFSPSPPNTGPPVEPAPKWRNRGGRYSGSAANDAGGTTTNATYTTLLGLS